MRRGPDPDLIIRMLDGQHSAISASSTDYLTHSFATDPGGVLAPEEVNLVAAPPLLSIKGLLQVVQFMDELNLERNKAASKTSLQPLPFGSGGHSGL